MDTLKSNVIGWSLRDSNNPRRLWTSDMAAKLHLCVFIYRKHMQRGWWHLRMQGKSSWQLNTNGEQSTVVQNKFNQRKAPHLLISFEYGGWRRQNMYIYPSQAYSLFLKAHYFWGCTEGTSGPGLQTRLILIKIYKGCRMEMGLYGQKSRHEN